MTDRFSRSRTPSGPPFHPSIKSLFVSPSKPGTHRLLAAVALTTAIAPCVPSWASPQDATTPPAAGGENPTPPVGDLVLEGGLDPAPPPGGTRRRRPADDSPVILGFRKEKIESVIPFIVEWTGKVVILRLTQVAPIEITIVNDQPLSKDRALDLLFQAFRMNGIGVVETDDVIMIEMLTDMEKIQPAVILGPTVDVMALPEDGNIVIKVFKMRNTKATDLYDRLSGSIPTYAALTVDANSNQLILEGDIGLAKRIQQLITVLDVPPWVDVQTETFRLAYADAQTIADNIRELFEPSGSGANRGASTRQAAAPRGQGRPGQPAGGGGEVAQVGTSEQLVVTVLPQNNAITVRAEPEVMKSIRTLISTAWDIPPTREGQIFRLYDLKYTDPLKVKEVLGALLESGSVTRRPAAAGGRAPTGGQAGGADVAVANIFRIEAYPDSNRLVVISRTPDNFQWLDVLIEQIDQPLSVGLPRNVELKHASAVEVAEILNALLQQSGGGATLEAPEQGLTGIDFASAGGGEDGGAVGATEEAQRQEIRFPWQQARTDQDATEVSAIVGKSRVVPNAGQNSLLVLATPEIQDALLEIIAELDRPGRQVLISAVLAEVELGDQFAFGVQFGPNGQINPSNPNNAVTVGGSLFGLGPIFEGTLDPVFPGSLTTSTLNFGVDATVLLQALSEKTGVRILQQPRVFTSDNKEAKFFDGQDVPFQSSTSSGGNTGGTVVADFEQIAVGIGLNVRPRITKDLNVAMEVAVLLSDVNRNPGFSVPGNNPVINRRQTNTAVTVKNGQTIVISGIRKEGSSKVKTGFPVLGDIPVLDWVFSYTDEVEGVKELVIFITPIVVNNPDENDVNFNVQDRERLRQLSAPLEEETRKLILENKFIPVDAEQPGTPPLMDAPQEP